METKTILTEEEKKEFLKEFTRHPVYNGIVETEINHLDGYGEEALEWFEQLLAKKLEDQKKRSIRVFEDSINKDNPLEHFKYWLDAKYDDEILKLNN